jgi:hypothetical protein
VVAQQSEVALRPIYDGMPYGLENRASYRDGRSHVVGMFAAVCDELGTPIAYEGLITHEERASRRAVTALVSPA